MKKYYKYVEEVLNKKIIASENVIKACKRFQRDLEKSKKSDYPYIFIEEKADLAIKFIENLKLFEGKFNGKNFILEDWQAFVVANLFGWVFKENHKIQRFKKSFIFVARGNGKTPLAAAIGLIYLLKDYGSQVYSIATQFQQAYLIKKHMEGFIKQDKILSEQLVIQSKSIQYPEKIGIYRPLSKAFEGFDGFNPSCIIADEVAAMQNYDLLEVLETALHKREDSILIMITTANFISFDSPGWQEYQHSIRALNSDNEIYERYFTILFEIDKNDDWKNTKIYKKANPSSFVNIKLLEQTSKEVQEQEVKRKGFITKNLNRWQIGAANSFVSIEKIKKCSENYKKYKKYLTEENLLKYPVAIGADFSERRDLTAFTTAFYIPEIDKIYFKHNIYIPENSLKQKNTTDNQMFNYWVKKGYITLCSGDYIDKIQVALDIIKTIENYNVKYFCYDPYSSVEIIEQITKIKPSVVVLPIQQTLVVMSEPTKNFEELINKEKIIDDNPVALWCLSNARTYQSKNLIKIQKETKNSYNRIDTAISSILSLIKLNYKKSIFQKKETDMKSLLNLMKKIY